MKKLVAVVFGSFAMAFSSLGVASESEKAFQKEQTTESGITSGKMLVEQIKIDFSNGEYSSFLKGVDSSFSKGKKEFAYDSLIESRKEYAKALSHVKATPVSSATEAFQQKSEELLLQRNKQLIALIDTNKNDPLAQSLEGSVVSNYTEDQKAALEYLFDLKNKTKGEGKTPLENELINIDMEYWLKARDLDTAFLQKKYTQEQYDKLTIVLELEKLEKMKDASLKEPSSPIAERIFVAYGIYPSHAAVNYDQRLLLQIGEGKIAATTPFQEQVKNVMQSYLNSKEALITEYFPEEAQ